MHPTAVASLVVTFGVLPFTVTPSAAGSPEPTSPGCDLPTSSDLIIWDHRPRLADSAFEIGDADLSACKPSLDTWKAGQPTGPGYCSKIAWASDNPGYDVDVRPALPLKKVIDEVGDC